MTIYSPVPENSYLRDCISTTITELPDLVSWCDSGAFISIVQIDFNLSSDLQILIPIEDLLLWIEVDGGVPPLVQEDLTIYTLVKILTIPFASVTATAPKVAFNLVMNQDRAFLYKDFGAGFFDSTTVVEFEIDIGSPWTTGAVSYYFGLSNTIGSANDMDTANDGFIFGVQTSGSNTLLFCNDFNNGQFGGPFFLGSLPPYGSLLYCRFTQSTKTVDVFTDSARTVLLASLVTPGAAISSKQYLYSFISAESTTVFPTATTSGFGQNYNVISPVPAVVGYIVVTSPKSDVTAMPNSVRSYVYKNYGVDYFEIGTEIEFEFELTAGDNNSLMYVFGLSNTIGTQVDMWAANDGIMFGVENNVATVSMFLTDREEVVPVLDTYIFPAGPPTSTIYATFKLNALNSTIDLYSDAGRTVLLDQLIINQIPSKKRYLYCTISPESPGILTLVDTDDQGGYYQSVWGDGNFLYVACGPDGLRTYSVDGSGNLTFIDSDDQGGDYIDVWGDGTYIYAACAFNGLRTYSVDGSGNLTFIDSDAPAGVNYGSVHGDANFIYVSNGFNGINSYSVDGGGNLTLVDVDDQGASYTDVWGDGTYIYTVNGTDLLSYTVDGGGNLTFVTAADTGLGYYRVWSDGIKVFITDGFTGIFGLKVYSVDGGGNSTFIADDFQGDNYFRMHGEGTFLFVANGNDGLLSYLLGEDPETTAFSQNYRILSNN